jgi:hypothetical protein
MHRLGAEDAMIKAAFIRASRRRGPSGVGVIATVGAAVVAVVMLVSVPLARADQAVAQPLVGSTSSTATVISPVAAHPTPRLKLSYREFAISNLDLSRVPLSGVQLDVYPLSMRWVRAGLEAEAGTGRASLNQNAVDLWYAMLGMTAGVQYPARVTPFVEGRLVGGTLGGNLEGAIAIPGTSATISGTSAVTWILGRGIDVGAEVFMVGRAYVSASIGWLHTTWHGIDYGAFVQDPSAALRTKDLSFDSFTFKLGLGI